MATVYTSEEINDAFKELYDALMELAQVLDVTSTEFVRVAKAIIEVCNITHDFVITTHDNVYIFNQLQRNIPPSKRRRYDDKEKLVPQLRSINYGRKRN